MKAMRQETRFKEYLEPRNANLRRRPAVQSMDGLGGLKLHRKSRDVTFNGSLGIEVFRSRHRRVLEGCINLMKPFPPTQASWLQKDYSESS